MGLKVYSASLLPSQSKAALQNDTKSLAIIVPEFLDGISATHSKLTDLSDQQCRMNQTESLPNSFLTCKSGQEGKYVK
jgi:hypothetical protein